MKTPCSPRLRLGFRIGLQNHDREGVERVFNRVPMALRATNGDENGFEWSTIVIAGDGRGRNRSGDVEAATEFDPGRVC